MKRSLNLLPFRDASKKTNKGRTAIYQEIAQGTFPRPVKTGARSVAWVESEIDEWIERRIAERDAARTFDQLAEALSSTNQLFARARNVPTVRPASTRNHVVDDSAADPPKSARRKPTDSSVGSTTLRRDELADESCL